MTRQGKGSSGGSVRRSRWSDKVLVGLAFSVVAGAFYFVRGGLERPKSPHAATKESVIRKETRPTLSPARFVGKVARAHEVAQDIPDVLDQLYCYCECDKHMGHKSLLSCYTDGHAAT